MPRTNSRNIKTNTTDLEQWYNDRPNYISNILMSTHITHTHTHTHIHTHIYKLFLHTHMHTHFIIYIYIYIYIYIWLLHNLLQIIRVLHQLTQSRSSLLLCSCFSKWLINPAADSQSLKRMWHTNDALRTRSNVSPSVWGYMAPVTL